MRKYISVPSATSGSNSTIYQITQTKELHGLYRLYQPVYLSRIYNFSPSVSIYAARRREITTCNQTLKIVVNKQTASLVSRGRHLDLLSLDALPLYAQRANDAHGGHGCAHNERVRQRVVVRENHAL